MQFSQPIINQLIVYDVTTNVPVINIGPGPTITITQPGTNPASTLKLTTSGTNLYSPEIIWSYFGSQKLRIRTGSNIVPTPVFMEYLTNGVVTSGITLTQTQVSFGTSDTGGVAQNGVNIFDTFTRVQRPIVASQVLDGPSGSNEVWHDLPFLFAGWTNNGGGYDNGGYRIMPDGTVMLRGLLIAGTTVDGTVFATLPAGYRPGATKFLGAVSNVAGRTPVVQIFTNGDMQIFLIAGLGGAVSLDGLRFELPII